jgi:ABC-type transporter Mla maintaining outer membrane lipid asymmetry ATPase subunit MlaF
MPSSTSFPVSPDGAALAVRSLTGPAGHTVIRSVDLTVGRGSTQVVLGPIHGGKSMVMRHLLGLERASEGTVSIDGEAFDATRPSEKVLRHMRTKIGAVFEGSALLSRLSAVENVELPLLEHTDTSAAEAREAAQELLDEVGVVVDDDTTPALLGRAERRRVALARAMALRPPIILLDEPTLGLDPHAASELDETLARVQDAHGFGVLIFSHEVRYAFGRADHIYVLADGAIVEQGPPETVQHSDHPIVRQLIDRRGN